MSFIDFLLDIMIFFLDILSSTLFIVLLFLIVICSHLLFFLLRDKKIIKIINSNKDPESITLEDLNEYPLVNIIVPAWDERKRFEECLDWLRNLRYPNLKIIVNAGGSERTINTAESYKNYDNFIILRQKPLGKIRALNDCLEYVNEGIVYSIDSDVLVDDECLLRLIYPIINLNQKVVSGRHRPFKEDWDNDLVNYLVLVRNAKMFNFSREGLNTISGSNTCFHYEVIKAIGKFTELGKYGASDIKRGYDVKSKGFKIYQLNDLRSGVYAHFPITIGKYMNQNARWIGNSLKDKGSLLIANLKFLIVVIFSLYIFIIPILFFLNIGLFFIGIAILVNKYLKVIRKYVFYRATTDKRFQIEYRFKFFVKIIIYIIAELITNVLTLFRNLIKKKRAR